MAGLDDSTLVAFVDGELDAAASGEVEQRLADDPAAQEKVRLLRASAALVRAAMAGPEWIAVPPRLAGLAVRSPIRRAFIGRRRAIATAGAAIAAGVAGIAVGVAGRSLLAREPDEAALLLDEVAEYHTVYARDPGGLDIAPASARSRISAWFADVLGRRLAIPDLAPFGFTFHGARLLVADGRPVTQLLYARPEDAAHPLGVCVTAWAGADRALSVQRRDGVELAFWARQGFAYVLVGWVRPALLRQLATSLKGPLEKA